MRPRENYSPLIAVALVLTLAIFTSFQLYILREPTRIAADEAKDKLLAVSAGRSLFADNCAMCHGENGEGVAAPALNDKQFLAETHDEVIFSLISSGVPGTKMPAWNQAHGGPFTDQQVRQLVAFIRSWEANAPDRRAQALAGDLAKGLVIFSSTCFVCHGENGQGTARAPALNDPVKLAQFDDAWYAETIANGRPAKGMPTWGTVLAPTQIRDIVALLRAWQRGETVNPPGPGTQGEELFAANCASCHGAQGTGLIGPNLHANPFIRSQNDVDLIAFILAGRQGTAMPGFQGRLTEEQLSHIVALLRTWQK